MGNLAILIGAEPTAKGKPLKFEVVRSMSYNFQEALIKGGMLELLVVGKEGMPPRLPRRSS